MNKRINECRFVFSKGDSPVPYGAISKPKKGAGEGDDVPNFIWCGIPFLSLYFFSCRTNNSFLLYFALFIF